MKHSTTCIICKRELTATTCEFFQDGVKLSNNIDGMTVHRIRAHGENFPNDIKDFLLYEQNKSNKSRGRERERVNRANVCPFLIKVLIKQNQLFTEEDFLNKQPQNELAIHTWMDSTLREICDLVKEVSPPIREWGTRLTFKGISMDRRGKNIITDIGFIDTSRAGRDDEKTLNQARFQIGDFLAVSVFSRNTPRPEN